MDRGAQTARFDRCVYLFTIEMAKALSSDRDLLPLNRSLESVPQRSYKDGAYTYLPPLAFLPAAGIFARRWHFCPR